MVFVNIEFMVVDLVDLVLVVDGVFSDLGDQFFLIEISGYVFLMINDLSIWLNNLSLLIVIVMCDFDYGVVVVGY